MKTDREFIKVKRSTKEINKILGAKNIKMPSSYYYNLGRYYAKADKSKDAIEQFVKAIKLNPKQAKYYFALGSELTKRKKYNEALRYFNRIIKIQPDLIRAWCGKGFMEGSLGRHRDSLKTFRTVLAKKPDCLRKCPSLYANIGLAYYEVKRYQLAIKYFDKALILNPKDYQVWRYKGRCYKMLGNYEKALKYFNKALKLSPNDRLTLISKDEALEKLGRYKESLICLNKMIKINPKDDIAITNKGSVLCQLGRHKEELLCYKKVIKINPKNYVAWSNYGTELIRNGDLSNGIKCIDKAKKINPKYISEPAILSKAFALIKQRKYKLAILSVKKIIKYVKKDADTYYNLACLYSLIKNTDAALKMLKKSVSLDKNYKVTAKKDPDFKNIQTSQAFIKLVAE